MATWGDINAVLNRLVRTAKIAGFWTNLAEARHPVALHVVVRPPGAVSETEALALRSLVEQELAPCAPDATVTVDRTGSHFNPSNDANR
jgi:hypothetical protein